MFSSIGLPNAVKLKRPTFVFVRCRKRRFRVLPGDRVGLLRIPLVETWGLFYSWPWDLQVWETPSGVRRIWWVNGGSEKFRVSPFCCLGDLLGMTEPSYMGILS